MQPKAPLVEEIQSQQTNSLQVVVNDLTVVCYKELMTITFQRSNLKETFSDFGFTGIEFINASADGQFIVVDLSNYSFVIRVPKKNERVLFFNNYPIPEGYRSTIDTTDLLCASYNEHNVIIWDFVKGILHRDLVFKDDKIIYCCFDERNGIIWIITTTIAHLYSINCAVIAKVMLMPGVTSACFVDKISSVVLGLNSGKLAKLTYSPLMNLINTTVDVDVSSKPITSLRSEINGKVFATNSENAQFVITY